MSHLEEMKNGYNAAGQYYESANRAPNEREKAALQEKGDEEYGKAQQAAEAERKEIRQDGYKKAEGFYDKQAEAYEKGDYKAAKEYQKQGDAVIKETEQKEKELAEEQKKLESESRSKMEGLEKRRY